MDVAHRKYPDAVQPQPLECVLQHLGDALDDHHDWRCARCRGAAGLIFQQRPTGERKQRPKAAGLVLLIGTDKRAKRHEILPSPLFFETSLIAFASEQRW